MCVHRDAALIVCQQVNVGAAACDGPARKPFVGKYIMPVIFWLLYI